MKQKTLSKWQKQVLIAGKVMKKAKEQVKEEFMHERLEKMGDRLDFWGKLKACIKIWS